MLENPKILIERKSLLFLKSNKNFKLVIKIIKGKSFNINPGIKIAVNASGVNREVFLSLKNSISSNKFKIKPKQ